MGKNYIDGIYNYCDRWCERCTFTSRCRNYEGANKVTPEQRDRSNKAFWNTISSNFENAIELLHKIAAGKGIDLNNISEEETKAFEERQVTIKTAAKEHILSKLSKQYQQTIMPFFEKQVSSELGDKERELAHHLNLGIKNEVEVVNTIAGLRDCEEVINWYLFFINAKLQRALRGKWEGDEQNEFQKDSDGSAKIAIIAIERSISAWTRLYELMPSAEDIALKALSLLSQLKQKTMAEFPRAMEFKRPGFDD